MSSTPPRLRIIEYRRISSDPRLTRIGVESQDVINDRAAAGLGDIVAVFEDNDLTAYGTKRRPDFEKMLEAIRNDEYQADMLLYVHYDRLLRTRRDFDRLVEAALAGGRTKRLYGVRSGEIDLSTAAGQMLGGILATIGNYEVAHTVERMQDAARRRAEHGKPWSPCRWFGYTLKDPKTGKAIPIDELPQHFPEGKTWMSGELVKDRREATLLREAYRDVRQGRALQAIARDWNAKGVKTVRGNTWKATVLRGVLLNPRNAGIREYRTGTSTKAKHRELVHTGKGTWPPIVSESTFKAVRGILTDPSRENRPKQGYGRRYLLTGIARCGVCGNPLGSTVNHGVGGYLCRQPGCGKVSRRVDVVDQWVIGHVVARLSREDAVDLLRAEGVDNAELDAQSTPLLDRLAELEADAADPAVPYRITKAAIARVTAELELIERKRNDSNKSHVFGELIKTEDKAALFASYPLDRQRTVIDKLLTVTVHPGQASRRPFDETLVAVVPKV